MSSSRVATQLTIRLANAANHELDQHRNARITTFVLVSKSACSLGNQNRFNCCCQRTMLMFFVRKYEENRIRTNFVFGFLV